MDIRNYSPFPVLPFETIKPDGARLQTVVIRGTFKIQPGERLRPLSKQEPLFTTDQFRDGNVNGSLLFESDVIPLKPRTDVVLNAVAHSPGGAEKRSWQVAVKFGDTRHSLQVTGPRYWAWYSFRGWELSDPAPCTSVPMHYERAYGGTLRSEKRVAFCEQNPVGVGFYDDELTSRKTVHMAPQIENEGMPLEHFEKAYPVEGLAPLAKSWLPRRRLAGTADETWLKKKWPQLPDDFDYAYFNGAHPNLTHRGYVVGNEQVTLQNLDPSGQLEFSLPGYFVSVIASDRFADVRATPCQLDTVNLDVPAMKAMLTWRAAFKVDEPIRYVDVRLLNPLKRNHGRQ